MYECLRGANLSGTYLGRADRHEADLSEANLPGAQRRGAIMEKESGDAE